MNITNSTWTKGLLGAGVAIGTIVGTSMMYPMTSTNMAGHMLAWVMGGVIGIIITLSSFEGEDSWMEASTHEEADRKVDVVTAGRRLAHAAVAPLVMREGSRMSGQVQRGEFMQLVPPQRQGILLNSRPVVRMPADEDRRKFIEFAAQNPICSLATLDEEDASRPRVRTVFLWRADENGFYFVLFSSKKVSRQVKANPAVELCFQNHPANVAEAKQLRVSGRMELMENRELREQAAKDRHILNTLAGDGSKANIEVYRLDVAEMKFWEMAAATTGRAASAQMAHA